MSPPSPDPTPAPVTASEPSRLAGHVRARWAWTDPTVWTDRMLTTLETGVRGLTRDSHLLRGSQSPQAQRRGGQPDHPDRRTRIKGTDGNGTNLRPRQHSTAPRGGRVNSPTALGLGLRRGPKSEPRRGDRNSPACAGFCRPSGASSGRGPSGPGAHAPGY